MSYDGSLDAGCQEGLTNPLAQFSQQLYPSLKIAKVVCQQPLVHAEQAWPHPARYGKVFGDTPQ